MTRFDRAYLTNMQPVISSYLGGEWTLNVSDRPQMSRIDYLWNVPRRARRSEGPDAPARDSRDRDRGGRPHGSRREPRVRTRHHNGIRSEGDGALQRHRGAA